MSAEAVGKSMPDVVTLDDLAAMIEADAYGHRYETDPDGTLSVVPPPDSEHAVIATRLMAWLLAAGLPVDQVLQVVGVRIPGSDGVGGRIPDLTLWSRPQPAAVWLDATDLRLVVEIVSRGSEAIDKFAKVGEYASVGVPQYWVVNRDPAQTVIMHGLVGGAYEVSAKVPLAWLLQTRPADHGLSR
jgi:Uma2 family endonuclease